MRWIVVLTLMLASLGGVSMGAEPTGEPKAGAWTALPLPRTIEPGNWLQARLAVDRAGTLWMLHGEKLYFWDVERFRAPIESDLLEGWWCYDIGGNPERGAYLIGARWSGAGTRALALYELSGGRVRRLAQYDEAPGDWRPSGYISRSGNVFLYSSDLLVVLHAGGARGFSLAPEHVKVAVRNWGKVVEERDDAGEAVIVETDDAVHVLANHRMYSVHADGRLTERAIPLTLAPSDPHGNRRFSATRIGQDKVLVHDSQEGFRLYRLADFSVVPITGLPMEMDDWTPSRIAGFDDGSAWLAGLNMGRYSFRRLSPRGALEVIPGSRDVRWENASSIPQMFPFRPVLQARDGAVWVGQPAGRIGRWTKWAVRFYGWKEGVVGGAVTHFVEGTDGTIYALTWTSILRFDPEGMPPPLSPEMQRWTELRTLHGPPAADGKGGIWAFLADRTDEVSRWDGREWRHVKFPLKADPGTQVRTMADDRGHLLVDLVSDEAQAHYDISVEGYRQYPTREALLEAAARDGARSLRGSGEYTMDDRVVIGGDGRIFFITRSEMVIVGDEGHFVYSHRYYDGRAWKEAPSHEYLRALYASDRNGFVAQFELPPQEHMDHGRGRWPPLGMEPYVSLFDSALRGADADAGNEPRLMMGPDGIQPFESSMVARRPDQYVPVERFWEEGRERTILLRRQPLKTPLEYVRGDGMPDGGSLGHVMPSALGGQWAPMNSHRIMGARCSRYDLRGTPLQGLQPRWIADDTGGNVWFSTGGSTVFMRSPEGFGIRPLDAPATVPAGGEATFHFSIQSVSYPPADIRLFWRYAGNAWMGGDKTDTLLIPLPKPGEYDIEVLGMDPLGATTASSLKLKIKAE